MYNAQTQGICQKMNAKFDPVSLDKIQSDPYFLLTEKWFQTRAQGEKLTLLTAVPDSKLSLNMSCYPGVEESVLGLHKFYTCFLTHNYKVTVGRTFAVIEKVDSYQKWLTTRDHFLCLMDIISQRFMIILSTIIGKQDVNNVIPPSDLILQIFRWGDEILNETGNNGYDALKMWEALVSSSILEFKIDSFIDNQDFACQTYESFEQAIPGYETFLKNKLTRIKEILLFASNLDLNYITQLHGLYRIWGHPSIEGLLAVNKLQVYGRRRRLCHHHVVTLITNKFKEVFSFGYFDKFHKWPVFRIQDDDQSYIARTLREGQLLDKKHQYYDLMDWGRINFGKTFNPPEKYDISQTITDKSLSLNSDELYEAVKKDKTIGHDRSVILKWLESTYEKPLSFLNKISEYGFYGNQNVLGLYPKERELKTTARLFGMMPFEKRAYICLTEQMVADFVLPCFKEITLTQSETRNLNTMHSTTKSASVKAKNQSSSVEVMTGLDFEKWNTNMREDETHGIMKCLDDLFGLNNVFTRGHSVFLNTGFYLADGSITPTFEEVPYNEDLTENALPDDPEWEIRALWDPQYDPDLLFDQKRRSRWQLKDSLGVYSGNIGGMEGMRQKVWTIFTVVIIKCVADLKQVSVRVIGQGDNQILHINYRKSTNNEIRKQHNAFMEDLESFIALIGPPLNRTECWSSTSYFLYGKYPIIDGMPKSMSLKKICRMFRLNNDSLMNVDSVLGAISANASAATKMSFSCLVPFVIGKLESLGALELYLTRPVFSTNPPICHISKEESFKRHSPSGYDLVKFRLPKFVQKAVKDIHNLTEILAIVPSILGGYSNLMYQDLLLHGFPDPLTLSLCELKFYHDFLPQTKSHVRKAIINLVNPQFNPYKEPSLLLENPVAINLNACSRPKDLIRTLIFQHLQKMPEIKNRPFKTMLSLAAKQQKLLARAIFSIHPFRSKVGQLLYESTVPSQAARVIRKVEKTRTMIRLTAAALMNLYEVEHQEMFEEDIGEIRKKRTWTLNEFFYQKDQQYFRSVLYQISTYNFDLDFHPSQSCSYLMAVMFREKSWGKKIEGISVPYPLSFLTMEEADINCRLVHHHPEAGYIQMITSLLAHEYLKAFNEIGPSTPFFGSETKDKIEYEGKKLARVVPSILTRAALNLEIVIWGTPLESNLSKLMFGLFSSITNADPLQLIPNVSGVASTLDHRLETARVDNQSTISINFGPSTHCFINTSTFNPELLPHMEGKNDHNIVFQSVFSIMASLFCMFIGSQKRVPSCWHIHLDCIQCVQPVSTEMMDMPPDILEEALEEINSIEKNEYTYVDMNALGVKVGSPVQMRELSEIQEQSVTPEYLSFLAALWVCENSCLPLLDEHLRVIEESRALLHVPTVLKMNVRVFYDWLALLLLLRHISYKMSPSVSPMDFDLRRSKDQATDTIISYPVEWFKILQTMMLSDETLQLFCERKHYVNFPIGTPPKPSQYSLANKQMVIHAAKVMGFSTIRHMLFYLRNVGFPLTKNQFLHPVWVTKFCELISAEEISKPYHELLLLKLLYSRPELQGLTSATLISPIVRDLRISNMGFVEAVERRDARIYQVTIESTRWWCNG